MDCRGPNAGCTIFTHLKTSPWHSRDWACCILFPASSFAIADLALVISARLLMPGSSARMSRPANIGRWVAHLRASSLLISTVVVNLTTGSVEASSWQPSETCCPLIEQGDGRKTEASLGWGRYSRAVSADFASPDHFFKNLVAVASKVSVTHERGRLLTDKSQLILGQMPAR